MIEILMATYNSAAYLDAQIDSLFSQIDLYTSPHASPHASSHTSSYPPFTLTIRDNRSTDTTWTLLQRWQSRYPNRIRLHLAPEHGNALSNFSALLTLSTANILAFCDSDDIWLPNKLAISMQKLEHMETRYGKDSPCLVYTDLTPTDVHLRPLTVSFWKESGFPPKVPSFSHQLMRNRLTGCTLLFNRALATLADPIPCDALMHDAWLGLVATAFGHIDLIQEPTVLYRQHTSNTLGSVPSHPLNLIRSGKFSTIWKRRLHPHGRFAQGQAFLHRYAGQLTSAQKDILQAFLLLPQSSWLGAMRLMKRNQFYEPTWAWTLYTFLFRLRDL